ncbi:MFS transporter [Roseomonas hellenica]|uniref:MFS transporter n=1 Tax=Plastoroseomonas hellenica TaxID=2687306 RepID=A0ABS5F2J8_9PROT|nr:MFS transporter [Plastoroseomonas hellenica]MBR0666763.1 MFS transporter [Plastoroseomonas hellenica]
MSDISIAQTPSRAGFFGWRVTGAAFTIAVFAWGIGFYGPPVFLQTLHGTHGWPVALVSAAITTHFLLGAAVVANLAALHRRFGIVAVTRAGGLLTALGLLGWAFAREPWQLFAATLLSGAGWAMTSGAALNAMISPWFIRRRPAALGMAFNGASIGGVVFSPLWVALIAGAGFPLAALIVAAAVAVVLWVLAGRYLGRQPAAMGLLPDGAEAGATAPAPIAAKPAAPLASPWRDRRFLTLAGAATLGLFAQIGLVAQLFSLLVPLLGAGGAGLTMGAVTALAVGGRTLLGLVLRPGADRRSVAAANVALQACGSIVLLAAGTSVPLVLLGCGLFGLGLGNVTSLPPLIAQGEFAPADVPRVVALVTAISQAGYAFAPAAFGLLRDIGAEAAAVPAGAPLLFATAAVIQLLSAGALLLGRPR